MSTIHRTGNVVESGPDPVRHEETEAASSQGDNAAGLEIAGYLTIIRKRIWVLVLIPLLAAGIVLAVILTGPTTYSATATVAAPWLISNAPGDAYDTSSGASQFVADFIAAISVPPVVDAVADATGAPETSLRENVTVTPIGESSLIQV